MSTPSLCEAATAYPRGVNQATKAADCHPLTRFSYPAHKKQAALAAPPYYPVRRQGIRHRQRPPRTCWTEGRARRANPAAGPSRQVRTKTSAYACRASHPSYITDSPYSKRNAIGKGRGKKTPDIPATGRCPDFSVKPVMPSLFPSRQGIPSGKFAPPAINNVLPTTPENAPASPGCTLPSRRNTIPPVHFYRIGTGLRHLRFYR